MDRANQSADRREIRQRRILAALLVCIGALGLGGTWWPAALYASQATKASAHMIAPSSSPGLHMLVEVGRLLFAALIGLALTLVQRRTRRDPPLTRSMEHAHVLLCVSGALTMILVGDSLARALGI